MPPEFDIEVWENLGRGTPEWRILLHSLSRRGLMEFPPGEWPRALKDKR